MVFAIRKGWVDRSTEVQVTHNMLAMAIRVVLKLPCVERGVAWVHLVPGLPFGGRTALLGAIRRRVGCASRALVLV